MTVINETLIPFTVYGTPSGNYDGSSSQFVGSPAKAVNYYRGQGHLETVWINVENFMGVITVEANLDREPGLPEEDDYWTNQSWFTVATYGDPSSSVTDYHPIVIAGNYTWLRVKITDFNGGTIRLISLTY